MKYALFNGDKLVRTAVSWLAAWAAAYEFGNVETIDGDCDGQKITAYLKDGYQIREIEE